MNISFTFLFINTAAVPLMETDNAFKYLIFADCLSSSVYSSSDLLSANIPTWRRNSQKFNFCNISHFSGLLSWVCRTKKLIILFKSFLRSLTTCSSSSFEIPKINFVSSIGNLGKRNLQTGIFVSSGPLIKPLNFPCPSCSFNVIVLFFLAQVNVCLWFWYLLTISFRDSHFSHIKWSTPSLCSWSSQQISSADVLIKWSAKFSIFFIFDSYWFLLITSCSAASTLCSSWSIQKFGASLPFLSLSHNKECTCGAPLCWNSTRKK